MGICCVSVTATDAMIARVHQEPPLIWRLYEPQSPEYYLDAIGANTPLSWFDKLLGRKPVVLPDPLPDFHYQEGQRFEVDLDKSWDGINFCLQRILPKGSLNIFEDGELVGDVDVGYDPAMTVTSRQVIDLNATYKNITPDQLLQVFNPGAMKKVYPKRMWQDDSEENKEYLIDYFLELQDYIARAAAMELGIVVVYT
jgi:hypothetical protein